jgi:hypothetical protein
VLGDDHAQDGVTQELEALVRAVTGVLGAPGPMRQRCLQLLDAQRGAEAEMQLVQVGGGTDDDGSCYSRATT